MGDGLSRKLIDVWKVRPSWRAPFTAVFGSFDTCEEEQRLSCSGPRLSLFCLMAIKLGASEPTNRAVWILLVLGYFVGPWAIDGIVLAPMREFSIRLGWVRWPAWCDSARLQQFGRVVRFRDSHPVCRVISEKISPACLRPRGKPSMAWFQRIDWRCQELGLAPSHGSRDARPLVVLVHKWNMHLDG